jgi:nucleoside-diphosphate-sugar epimerase
MGKRALITGITGQDGFSESLPSLNRRSRMADADPALVAAKLGLAELVAPEQRIVVTGAGGFIGGHLLAELRRLGYRRLRGVDVKAPSLWHQRFPEVENIQADLKSLDACREACRDAAYVFNLAADMGGMGFIETHKADCMLSVLINTHMLMAAREMGVQRFLFASSACVYPAGRQTSSEVTALREVDAYPAEAEDGYGWEKLFSERMCRHFSEDFSLEVRVVRYHNVYGPLGTFEGGREKAPAAICRKVAEAKLSGRHEIEIWGDGEQTRSFMYIDDCILGTQAIMASTIDYPINLGSAELVSINRMVDIVEEIAGTRLERRYRLDAPQGVRGRNSDNAKIREELGWEPDTQLRDGLERTFAWIWDELAARRRAA